MKGKSPRSAAIKQMPPEAIQGDLIAWLRQVRTGDRGDPGLLITGLAANAAERWEIGVTGAWQRAVDPLQIVLDLPKPTGHPPGDNPQTQYWFDQESVFLALAHVFYGGKLRVAGSKHNSHYYPAVAIPGRGKAINLDRLNGNVGPYQDARQVRGGDYHDHCRANIKPTSERKVARQVGREHERANLKRGKVTRAVAIEASVALWRESLLFPTREAYRTAMLDVYAALDQRHPLAKRMVSKAP